MCTDTFLKLRRSWLVCVRQSNRDLPFRTTPPFATHRKKCSPHNVDANAQAVSLGRILWKGGDVPALTVSFYEEILACTLVVWLVILSWAADTPSIPGVVFMVWKGVSLLVLAGYWVTRYEMLCWNWRGMVSGRLVWVLATSTKLDLGLLALERGILWCGMVCKVCRCGTKSCSSRWAWNMAVTWCSLVVGLDHFPCAEGWCWLCS